MKRTFTRFVNYCREKTSGTPQKELTPWEVKFDDCYRDALEYSKRHAAELAFDRTAGKLANQSRDEPSQYGEPQMPRLDMLDTERGRRAVTLVKLAHNLAFEGSEYEFMCDPLSEEQTQTEKFKDQQRERAIALIDYVCTYFPDYTGEPDRDDPHEPDI